MALLAPAPNTACLRGLIVTQIAVAFILANLAVLFSASYAKMLAANANLATDYVLVRRAQS